MAVIKNSTLGEVNGKIGNTVFRQMYGKTVASERPFKYRAAKTPAARKFRNGFGMAVKLAQKLIADPALDEIWSSAKIAGVNSNQRIIKNNIKLCDGSSLTAGNKITPEGLFLRVEGASFQDQKIKLILNCPAENKMAFPADLFVLYYFNNANKAMILNKAIISESSDEGIYETDIIPDKYLLRLLKEDPEPRLFIAMASETPKKKKVYWTSSETVLL